MQRSVIRWLAVLLVSALVFCAATLQAQGAGGFKVIVNAKNPTSSMTREQVSQVLLKKVTRWPDGAAAQPVDQRSQSPVRDAFSRSVHGRAASSIASYWKQQIFSGRGVPPPEKSGDAAVIQYVQSHRGAIGYVSAIADTSQVKVIKVN